DELLEAQLRQRVADRAAADRELLGERLLGDALSRGELTPHDPMPQHASNLGAEGFTPLHCLRHGDLLLTVDRIHTRPAEADRSILVVPLTGPPQHHFGGTADATTTGHRDHSGRPGGEHSHSWTVLPLCA